MITIQGKVEKYDIVEQCTQERQNTKWRFNLITKVTIFIALLKNIPMGCPDTVLSKPLLRNTQVNCLLSNKDKEPYKDHLCLFNALAMHMNGHTDFDLTLPDTLQNLYQNLAIILKSFLEFL